MDRQTHSDLSADARDLDELISQMKQIIVEYVNDSQRENARVVDFKTPDELENIIDFDLKEVGIGNDGIILLVKSIMQYSVNTWNPCFMDKLYAGTNPVGIISEMLITILNANAHVYRVSPAFTLIERIIAARIGRMLKMGETSGGVTCPGGAFSNQLAMITARNTMFPEIKTQGYSSFKNNLVVFTSENGHYSVDKTAMTLGIGTDNIIKVPCDNNGRMSPGDLERMINQSINSGNTPFFVNATAGTTVLGAFDPLQAIGRIAKKYNMWYHIDGSWGGSVIFSEKRLPLLDGSEMADSFTLNPHKMLGTPLQCSFLLMRDYRTLARSNSLRAGYLFHGHDYDLGDGTVGCGRRPDAVKLFLGWKYYGITGYERRIEHAFNMAKYLSALIKAKSKFKLLMEPACLQVCFWYSPIELCENNYDVYRNVLDNVTKAVHNEICKKGMFLFDYAPLKLAGKELPAIFRVVINSPSVQKCHLDNLVNEIESVGAKFDELFLNVHQ
ncbi:3385_t:CDS:2 [Paraglomus occultum]|uniref:3385_t:CDS:1 n=1 Tax=Paraglomus occultum TaxID=144539 RepID=A0A9N8WF30_9GLOM|nr:3385_t:CDS:2 [Paraglomus occultum]